VNTTKLIFTAGGQKATQTGHKVKDKNPHVTGLRCHLWRRKSRVMAEISLQCDLEIENHSHVGFTPSPAPLQSDIKWTVQYLMSSLQIILILSSSGTCRRAV